MYTHAEKKQIPANSGSRSGDVMSAVSSGVPNSAVLSMLGGGQGGGLPDLEQRMRERLALDNQIPDAEREADRLAASVSGARTPDEVKSQLGEKMGADFSGVRFHTDAGAVGMADNIGARAYTSGQDVYFGQGGFDPAVAAHELVHTAQQGVVESAMPTVSAPAGGVQMMPKIFQKVGGFFKNLFKSKEQKNLDKIAATNVPSRAGEQQPHLPFTPTQVQNMLTDSGGIRTDNSLKPHISPVTGAIQNEMGDYFDALENSGFDFADANKGIQKFDANATVHLRYNKGSVAATKKLLSMLSGHLDAPEMRELAQNINVMAQSVENHTEKLKLQAENRRQFVDSLAHEMKTPLTSILGFADMLRISRKIPEEKKAEYADIIFEEAKRLKNLSGKLMELSMTKHVDLDVAMVSAKELVLELKKTLAPLLAQKRARLLTKTEDMLVPMDRELMKSVFYNLIENACKASKDGQSILFTAERQDDQAVFRVTDKGIGMSEKDVKMAMEPFFMVDKLASRQAGGTGLGLMLCFEIVRQHKGRIHIDSQIGEGTMVTVSLPLSVPPEEDEDEKEEARG